MKLFEYLKSFLIRVLPKTAIRYPLVVVLVFMLMVSFFGFQLTNIYVDTDIANLTTGGEAETKAIETAANNFNIGDPLYIVLQGDMKDPEVIRNASNLVQKIRQLPQVMQIISPLDVDYYVLVGFSVRALSVAPTIPSTRAEVDEFRQRLAQSPNGKSMITAGDDAMLLEVYIRSSYSSRGKQTIDDLQKILTFEWGKGNFHLTGNSYLAHATDESIKRDAKLLFPLAAVVVVLVLLYSFRNLHGILIPGATVLVSLIVSIGLMAWLGYPLTIVSIILPIIIIVIGAADGIHILCKYQEVLQDNRDKHQAIQATMKEMAPPCIMTSLTTAVGLLSLQTSSVIPVKDFGLFAAVGVMTALVFSLIGIPALFALLPIPSYTGKRTFASTHSDTILLGKLGAWVMNHSKPVAIIGIAVLVLSAIGIAYLTVEANIARYFRYNSAVAQGIRIYEDKFGGSAQVLVVVDSNEQQGTLKPEFLPVLDEFEKYVATLPLVSSTSSMASIAREFSPDGELYASMIPMIYQQLPTSISSIYLSRDQQRKAVIHTQVLSAKTTEVAKTLQKIEKGLSELVPENINITVTGLPKIIQHHMQRFSESQVKSLIWSVLAVFCMLIVFHRSLWLGFYSILPLIFTLGINFGLMGWLGIPLDAATVLIGSIAIGIGIDYSIHFISRVSREQRAGKNLKTACQISISTAGHAIVINAITLIAGFLILWFSIFSILGVFGVLMALAMCISSIASVTVLPALLHLNKNKGRHYHD